MALAAGAVAGAADAPGGATRDWVLGALILTWAVVIPYLLLFPPDWRPLAPIRRNLRQQRDRRTARRVTVRPQWRAPPPAVAGRPTERPPRVKGGERSERRAGEAARWVVPAGSTAVVVLVNKLSGGQLGRAMLSHFRAVLSPVQVFDLEATPDVAAILATVAPAPGAAVRLLVAGGDGTVSWVMQAATACRLRYPLAVLPLGTGNDLGRALGWGGGVSSASEAVAVRHVAAAAAAEARAVDRWQVTIAPRDGGPVQQRLMVNYFSFGIDAEISLRFHDERREFPERFSSQQRNIVKYALHGFGASFVGKPLDDCCVVRALGPGTPVGGRELDLHPGWKGCIIASVGTYHGGKDFWGSAASDDGTDAVEGSGSPSRALRHGGGNAGDKPFQPALADDRRLEVMGLAGTFHIGLCNLAVDSALRVAQVEGVEVEVRREVAMQIDGEPWMQAPATIRFEHLDQYPMLAQRPDP